MTFGMAHRSFRRSGRRTWRTAIVYAVVCLDVLEHLPDPVRVIENIGMYPNPLVTPSSVKLLMGSTRCARPTSLSNLRYAGRTIGLFRRRGFAFRGTLLDRIREFQKCGIRVPFSERGRKRNIGSPGSWRACAFAAISRTKRPTLRTRSV